MEAFFNENDARQIAYNDSTYFTCPGKATTQQDVGNFPVFKQEDGTYKVTITYGKRMITRMLPKVGAKNEVYLTYGCIKRVGAPAYYASEVREVASISITRYVVDGVDVNVGVN